MPNYNNTKDISILYQTKENKPVIIPKEDNVNDWLDVEPTPPPVLPEKKGWLQIWLTKQVAAAKFAWTIVVVVAGVFGYSTSLTPIQSDGSIQQAVEQRLISIEQTLKTDNKVDPILAKNLSDLTVKIKEINSVVPPIIEQRLDNIETVVKNNSVLSQELSAKILNTQTELTSLIEKYMKTSAKVADITKKIPETPQSKNRGYTIPLPNVQ